MIKTQWTANVLPSCKIILQPALSVKIRRQGRFTQQTTHVYEY